MHLVETVSYLNDFTCCAFLKYLGIVVELIEIIQVSGSLILIRKMGQKKHIALGRENTLFFKDVLF